MALKGNLQDFSTTQLFNLINLARKTGTLTMQTREAQARLAFREGKLIYATLDGQQDRLVTMLERAGTIRRGRGRMDPRLFDRTPTARASIVDAVLRERDEGR